jgi:acyl-CoA synthetase (AMP-forming)/AMP-acid ligase II
MAETLITALEAVGSITHKGYTFLDNGLSARDWSFKALVAEARRRGARLRALGLEKGDRIAIIIPEPEDFILSFLGALTAGIVPVPMYPPLALGRLDGYIDAAASIMSTAGAKAILTTKQVSPVLWSLTARVRSLRNLILVDKLKSDAPVPELPPVEIAPNDLCFLQFTSGSTAAPKGVMVTHQNLCANSRAIIVDGLRTTETDRGVSWLPLYHDMGLIGFVIAPLFNSVPVVYMPTLAFVKRPTIWMETVHKYRGTITFGPNFAYGLAAKRAPKTQGALDLSCLRILGCGAEPINAETMRGFEKAFVPFGLSKNAIMPCYGMAEATLAIAFDDITKPFRTRTIDRAAYEEKNLAKPAMNGDAIELVSCGKTFPEHQVAIMGANGRILGDGEIGEIVVKGPSVTAGYFENAEATKDLLAGGWLHTGDLGFIADGELFISGRQKDLIILNGRNYHPQAVEWVVEQIQGIRRGNVVAFSIAGQDTEKLVIVAETTAQDHESLRSSVLGKVKAELGIAASEIVLVPKGAIPKTSSGKLQRRKTKSQYQEGSLGREGVRTIGSTAARVTLFRHVAVSAFARLRHRVRTAFEG